MMTLVGSTGIAQHALSINEKPYVQTEGLMSPIESTPYANNQSEQKEAEGVMQEVMFFYWPPDTLLRA